MKPGRHLDKPAIINPGSRRHSNDIRRHKRRFYHQVFDMTAVDGLLHTRMTAGGKLAPAVPVTGRQIMQKLFRRARERKQHQHKAG